MASEVGVLDIPPEDIVLKERLHPGRIFLVDTARGRIVSDEEIKRELAAAQPYGEWLAHLIDIEDLRSGAVPAAAQPRDGRCGGSSCSATRTRICGCCSAPMATQRRRADRLDGHRHVAGGAVGSAAPALRLLQAGVRAGHQPAARRDPRGAGDVDGIDDRARGQPARSAARVVPADQDQVPGHRQRPAREAAARLRARVPRDRAADAVRRRAGRPGPRARAGRPERAARATRSRPATRS